MSSAENQEHVLLHVCCAPCMIYPLKKLKTLNYKVFGFFCNPNIYPESEFILRKKNVDKFSFHFSCDISFSTIEKEADFLKAITNKTNTPERCQACWLLRLKETAKYAKANNFKLFTTTLLVSPYQDRILVKEAAEKAAAEFGVKFLYYDFSEGYQESVMISRQMGMYRQKYCGCRFSLDERKLAKKKDNKKSKII